MQKIIRAIFITINAMLITIMVLPAIDANAIVYPVQRIANSKAPWAVQLYYNELPGVWYPSGICTGTLIDPFYVLTAAHCVDGLNPEQLLVGVGGTSGANFPKIQVVDFIEHTGFNIDNFVTGNDIALIRLAAPSSMTPLALTGKNDKFARTKPGSMSLYGWGVDEWGNAAKRLGSSKQSDYGKSASKWFPDFIPSLQITAGFYNKSVGAFVGACNGDSGGPLVGFVGSKKPVLLGIVSYGEGDCLESPTIFTRVSAYLDWIIAAKQQLENNVPADNINYTGYLVWASETAFLATIQDVKVAVNSETVSVKARVLTTDIKGSMTLDVKLDGDFDGTIDGFIQSDGIYLGEVLVDGCVVDTGTSVDTEYTAYFLTVTNTCFLQTFGRVADFTIKLVGADDAGTAKTTDGWWSEFVMLILKS
jgi:hypothetical protein